MESKKITFIDLFAGIGGIRLGFEEACRTLGFRSKCIFSSEIKPHAISVYKKILIIKTKKFMGILLKLMQKIYQILIIYLRDFLVKHSALQAKEEVLLILGALYFLILLEY